MTHWKSLFGEAFGCGFLQSAKGYSSENSLSGKGKVLPAGACGGTLTGAGALFLDPTGTFKPGIPVAPCEGDAGTGMHI